MYFGQRTRCPYIMGISEFLTHSPCIDNSQGRYSNVEKSVHTMRSVNALKTLCYKEFYLFVPSNTL